MDHEAYSRFVLEVDVFNHETIRHCMRDWVIFCRKKYPDLIRPDETSDPELEYVSIGLARLRNNADERSFGAEFGKAFVSVQDNRDRPRVILVSTESSWRSVGWMGGMTHYVVMGEDIQEYDMDGNFMKSLGTIALYVLKKIISEIIHHLTGHVCRTLKAGFDQLVLTDGSV